MAYYRLYHIKRAHFCGVEEFDADDDPQALALARGRMETEAGELWSGPRKIGALQPLAAVEEAPARGPERLGKRACFREPGRYPPAFTYPSKAPNPH